jgi:hypothetical protein
VTRRLSVCVTALFPLLTCRQSALSSLSSSLSSGGSREKAAISFLGASLGVGSWSSWYSESP